jgi:hypothetical protein
MAAAASPARAAATFFFFDVVRRFPSFPATFEASAFAFPPARFAVFFARFADFLMLAMHVSVVKEDSKIPRCAVSHRIPRAILHFLT